MAKPIKVVSLEEDEHRPKKKGRIIKVRVDLEARKVV
jgi:hypothetical protein